MGGGEGAVEITEAAKRKGVWVLVGAQGIQNAFLKKLEFDVFVVYDLGEDG